MTPKERELLLHLIDEGYRAAAWHGTTLRGSLRGVSAKEAAKRPAPGRHSIWELAVHAAYWKYTVWRKLTGAKRGSFPRAGSNWLPIPSPATDAAWKRDLDMLGTMHRDLRKAVEDLKDLTPRRRRLIAGVAFHDVYHTGQIQFVKRLMRARETKT
ncbi:MAG TPA: DinB family protein [Planctomycetota bacterium]|nr:DinB family protein [Planctomycetota bacterium]